MERIDELKAWLRFNNSATDDYFGNSWTVSGNPTVASTNAEHDNALQLDGSSGISNSTILSVGESYTIDFWLKCPSNLSASATGYILNIYNPTTSKSVTGLYYSNQKIQWFFNGFNGSQLVNQSVTIPEGLFHVALVINQSSITNAYLFINGVQIGYVSAANYSLTQCEVHIGGRYDNTRFANAGTTIDEFRVYCGRALWTKAFTPPSASEYDGLFFLFDTQRKLKNFPLAQIYYKNPGRADLLTTSNGTTVTGLTKEQSITGVGFYQPEQTACFGLSATEEIWIRCDVYTTSNYVNNDRLRIYNIDSSNRACGWSTNPTITNSSMIFYNANRKNATNIGYLSKNKNCGILLHMKSDASDGLIEISLKNLTTGSILTDIYTGNVNYGNDFANVYIQMDGVNIYVSNLIISNAELTFEDTFVVPVVDLIRMPKIPATLWQYENAGTITDLINTNTAVQVNNLPQTQSKTGSAFYQTTEDIALFDIATGTSEIWIKFDVYSQSYGWKIFDYTNYESNAARVVGILALCNYTPGTVIRFCNYDGNSYGIIADVSMSVEIDDTLRTFILHMKADSTNGIIELFSDVDGLVYSFNGAVNGGIPFSKIDIVSGVDSGDADLFSNVIISNNPLWFYDNVSADISVSFSADAQRELLKSLLLSIDAERQIVGGSIQQSFYADAQRQIVIPKVIEFDTERSLTAPVELVCDTTRLIKNVVTTQVDTEIIFSYYLEVSFDISRVVVFVIPLAVDCEREIFATVDIDCDTFRKLVRNIVVPVYVPPEYIPPSHETPVFPRPEDNSVIQNCTISMQEQQLTDNISFTYAGHVNIMDAVNLQFLDYLIRGRVEETTSKGILESCHLTCDVDEILYRQLAYEVPENKFEWTAEYLAKINRYNAEHEEQVEKIPSAPASAHITEIASKLGKNVSLQFTDFISTMSTTVQSGTNYAGLISELFGWTSRIPHLMINVYMRDNTIHVIQRGQEQNTIILDNAKLAEPTIKRKLMRMTWGSDPWSKTEVVSRMKEWSEFNQSPYNPPEDSEESGGGTSYGDDNLVEETTVEHGEETVVTTYEYLEMGDGQKFLHKETAKTYSGGELVDTVVTTHEPVSYTQAHVYSTDDDGVIGGVVTNSNFDDRITPYQQEQIAGGGVAGHSDGMLVHDKDGNQYLLYGIAHHQDKEQIGNRTINGVTLIDTSFPVDGEAMLKSLTDAIKWLDRKTEESITVDVYDYPHVIDFNDKISLGGNIYYLRSNTVTVNEKIRNKQTIEIVRWY